MTRGLPKPYPMSRYQKHFGIATLRRFNLAAFTCLLIGLFSLVTSSPVWGAPIRAAPVAQAPSGNVFPAYYLMPLDDTTVELHTHTADFLVTEDAATGLTATLDAGYRLDNGGAAPVTVASMSTLGMKSIGTQVPLVSCTSMVVGVTSALIRMRPFVSFTVG